MSKIFAIACLATAMATSTAHAADVSVTVTNVDKEGGDVRVVMYADKADWLTHHGVNPLAVSAAPGELNFVFKDVKPGTYAILAYHDVNQNQDLDENFLGMPTEQFGFSNNPGYSHKPDMDESAFTVTDQPVDLHIKLSDG